MEIERLDVREGGGTEKRKKRGVDNRWMCGVVCCRCLPLLRCGLGARARATGVALPALVVPFLLIGGLRSGVFPATEVAAVGALYALILAGFYRKSTTRGSLVAAGAVLSPGMEVPDGMVAMGVPAKIVRAIKPDEIELVKLLVKTYIELAEKYFAGEFVDAANV